MDLSETEVFHYYENAMSVVNECVFKGMPTLDWMAIFRWSLLVSAPDEDESFFLLKKKAHSEVILYAKTTWVGVTPPHLTIIRKHLPPPPSVVLQSVESICSARTHVYSVW